jgi:hypothetical protein
MITANGYSKDPMIQPEGIAITWGKDLVIEKGGLRNFLRYFNKVMEDENCTWLQKCKNAPKTDIIYVYVIVCNRLYGRGYYGGYETGATDISFGDGKSWSSSKTIAWPRIVIGGPFERCPFKRTLKGFQGFRYTTKLF